MNLDQMKQKRLDLLNRITELQAGEDAEALNAAVTEAEALDTAITVRERAESLQNRLAQPAPRVAKPTVVAPAKVVTAEGRLDAFFTALPRGESAVMNTAGDLFKEGTNADGGYLLPVDKRELLRLLAPPEMVHSRCDIIFTPSNATTIPVDEDPVWSSSLAAGDVVEAAALTEGKTAFGTVDISLVKRGALARVTREMLEDNTGIGEHVITKLTGKLAWKCHALAVAAFIAAPSKKQVAKTGGAAVGSAPDIANVQAMWTSMLIPMREKAVWLANPQIETKLQGLLIPGSTIPAYMPANGLADAPNGKLFGRPIYFIEGLPAVGTEGDLMLVDPTSFFCVMKSAGPRIAVSTEAEFKNDVVCYSGYVRCAFKSKFTAVITRADSTTAGNVVTLQTR
jgi:HK97 family phage major capsid protein